MDIIDDAWAAMRSFLPHHVIEAVSPILIGSVGFIIHLGEGYEGAKLAYKAYQNEKIGQRKTRILTSVLTFMLAGAGVGMSLAFIASAVGAAVSATAVALFPVLIPGALTAIYGLSLWRQSYIFDRAKAEEGKAWDEYQAALKTTSESLDEVRKRSVENNYNFYEDDYAFMVGMLAAKKQQYEELREKRLEGEADVAFTTMEVASSALVLVGLALSIPAVVGATATFGLLPLAIIITGVVFAVGTKYFEKIDEDANHAYTQDIRNWFINTFTNRKSLDRDPGTELVAKPKSEIRASQSSPSVGKDRFLSSDRSTMNSPVVSSIEPAHDSVRRKSIATGEHKFSNSRSIIFSKTSPQDKANQSPAPTAESVSIARKGSTSGKNKLY